MRLTRLDITALSTAALLVALIVLSVVLIEPEEPRSTVLYMAPADGAQRDVWQLDPLNPEAEPVKLTDASGGVFDFSPSPDGRFLAYSEYLPDVGITEIRLLDLSLGQVIYSTSCLVADATCRTPVWRPDSQVIAYERQERNSALGVGVSPSRIWLLDLSVQPPQELPLFEESQLLGSQPVWSGDGTRLAFYEGFQQVILVYDFNAVGDAPRLYSIPNGNGVTGTLNADGSQVIYAELVLGGPNQSARAVLSVADLDADITRPLTPDAESLGDDGDSPALHPDGRRLAYTRQQLAGEDVTRGRQVYLHSLDTGQSTRLVFDDAYSNGALFWNPEGTALVIQRVPFGGGLPEIWTYALDDGRLTQVTENAFLPRWLPPPGGIR